MSGDSQRSGATGGERIRPAQFRPPAGERGRPRLQARPRQIALALLVAVFLLLTWFLFAARAVRIDTDPAEAEVAIETLRKFRLGAHYLLLPGEHRLQVTAPGYRPLQQSLPVGAEREQQVELRLERLPGHLVLDTGAVSGAEVFIDGEPRGRTPLTVRELAHGEHALRITAAMYFPHESTVSIEGLDREQPLSVELTPAWADAQFASEPAGAEILVDDAAAGVTPAGVRLAEGERALRVRLTGYQDWQRSLRVSAGETLDFSDIRLEPAEAVLFLSSDPPGAGTTVNGEYRGLTPLELALAPGRSSTIRLFKQGYRSATREVRANSGDNSRLNVALEPELASVEIRVRPEDAGIWIDGVSKGSGSQTLNLPTRRHTLEVRRDGYVSQKQALTPHGRFTQLVQIDLVSEQQARQASIRETIQVQDGPALKLFRPGEFVMGASRREPGRRANETLRTVQLRRPFYLSVREVSNREFRRFKPDHSSGRVDSFALDGEEQPAVRVSWQQAAEYCNWLSRSEQLPEFYRIEAGRVTGFEPKATGFRLPSEAEWEWAARSVPGGAPLKFPWPGEMPPPKGSGNYADETAAAIVGKVLYKYDDGFAVTAPAGSFPASANGLHDMGGNASEWVHDFYDIVAADAAPAPDPLGPQQGEFHVIRGSSWAHGSITELRLSYRDYGAEPRPDLGFRVARYLD